MEELVEDCWSDEHGQGQMLEGLHCKVEPDLNTINTEAALDRLLENGVVRDIPRAEGAGMKQLSTRWEKTLEETQQRAGVQGSLRGTRIQMAGVPGRPVCNGSFTLHWTYCGHSLAPTSCVHFHSGLQKYGIRKYEREMVGWGLGCRPDLLQDSGDSDTEKGPEDQRGKGKSAVRSPAWSGAERE